MTNEQLIQEESDRRFPCMELSHNSGNQIITHPMVDVRNSAFIEGGVFGLSLKKLHIDTLRELLKKYDAREITVSKMAELLNEGFSSQ